MQTGEKSRTFAEIHFCHIKNSWQNIGMRLGSRLPSTGISKLESDVCFMCPTLYWNSVGRAAKRPCTLCVEKNTVATIA
jgi:hypothetical protein